MFKVEWLRHPAATFLLGATCVAGLWLLNPPKEKVVEVEKKVVEIKEVEVTRWKTKFKERIVTKPDGTCTITRIGGSSSTTKVDSTRSEEGSLSRSMERGTNLSRYSLGLQATWEAATSPYDLSNYRLTAGARIGSLPVFGEVYLQGDLGFGFGITYQF